MSVQTPPTLMQLARQALLRNEALAISALEKLPMELFPGLFKDAVHARHTRVVTAMVEAWPFPCLPVGTLMKTPNMEIFVAVLHGIDMHLDTRRENLQVLDLRQVPYDFWRIQTGAEEGDGPAETVGEKQVVKVLSRFALSGHLTVMADLGLWPSVREEEAYLLHWVMQRKGSVQLCCTNLKIWPLPVWTLKKFFNFQPQHIEELELSVGWDLSTLAHFAPCLGQMRNLHKLSLTHVFKTTWEICNRLADRDEKCVSQFTSQFSNLNCLQHLSINWIYFLRGRMKQLLRCLTTPLETLTTTGFHLSQRDLNYFPLCHNLCQLKHLDMSGVVLLTLDPVPLRVLLQNVADTLQSLDLQGCRMKDSHLTHLIPALSQCSKLTKLNLYDNDFSMPILKDLLHHTANLRKLSVEQYPAPLQCYDESGCISVERFSHLCHELMDILRARRQPEGISFATRTCHKCAARSVYDLVPRLCFCLP
uniref:PRAME family member 12-like n=1 Tax=Myodes glareolus TaxID=447135 RepID=UPI00201FEEA2|nr:PRAME family member 12-like [Myodes glareolus]